MVVVLTGMSGRYNLFSNVIFIRTAINGTFWIMACAQIFMYKIPKYAYEYAAMVELAAVAVHSVNRAGFINGKDGLIFAQRPIDWLTLQA